VSSAGGSFSHTSFHIGSDLMARCSTYPDQVPILSLDAGNSSVSITPAGTEATDTAVNFARALLRSVQEFADEIERMHAAQHADPAADGSTESGTVAASTTAAQGKAA
jgi:hypothetical protein